MQHPSRREYKVMLDHAMFADRKAAVAAFGEALRACAKRLGGVEFEGVFEKTDKREITFLDTVDQTIRLNDFVFRKRHDLEKSSTEYTLKRRSPDRIIAASANVNATSDLDGERKLEEDIGAPFVVRFSASCTVDGPKDSPSRLRDAGELFPALLKLKRDDARCKGSLKLRPVNAIAAFERVHKGPLLRFDSVVAEAAIILWSDGAGGRPLVAEHSFRYGVAPKQRSLPKVARLAMRYFHELQRLDWCRPGASTKTMFVFGES